MAYPQGRGWEGETRAQKRTAPSVMEVHRRSGNVSGCSTAAAVTAAPNPLRFEYGRSVGDLQRWDRSWLLELVSERYRGESRLFAIRYSYVHIERASD